MTSSLSLMLSTDALVPAASLTHGIHVVQYVAMAWLLEFESGRESRDLQSGRHLVSRHPGTDTRHRNRSPTVRTQQPTWRRHKRKSNRVPRKYSNRGDTPTRPRSRSCADWPARTSEKLLWHRGRAYPCVRASSSVEKKSVPQDDGGISFSLSMDGSRRMVESIVGSMTVRCGGTNCYGYSIRMYYVCTHVVIFIVLTWLVKFSKGHRVALRFNQCDWFGVCLVDTEKVVVCTSCLACVVVVS